MPYGSFSVFEISIGGAAPKPLISEFLATDILAQAEHDPNASCFLVTDDERIAEESK